MSWNMAFLVFSFFFFQAEDGIRDLYVTGVQTCALPILTRGDVGVLSALRTSPPPHTLSPTQLFRGLMMSSAGMTKRLDRLEKVGLVKRNPDKDDRRGVTIHLTDRGRRLLARAVAENTKSEATLLSGLSGKERRLLADLLRQVLSRVEPAAGG